MKTVVLTDDKKRKKAKNNLDDFDAELIKAELSALENKAIENAKLKPNKVEESLQQQVADFRPRAAKANNSIYFSPDSSKLLHKAVRSAESATVVARKDPVQNVQVQALKPQNGAKLKLAPVQVKKEFTSPNKAVNNATKLNVLATPIAKGKMMDAFSRPATVSSSPEVKPSDGSEFGGIAMSGMRQANQLNGFLQDTQRTNLQNQLEKQRLFPGEIKPGSVVYDHGVQSLAVNRYNPLRNSHKMLGGVDQHNLGAGPLRRFVSMRSVKFLTPIVVIVLGGIYLFYLNAPKIGLKLAESKSGIAISAPSYVPNDFSLDRTIETETGKVTLNFVNGADNYSVSQSISDWDSMALLENKVLKETKDYNAYTDRGLTIYVYDGKAVWVNQGKVNEIDLGSAKLDVEEMIRIAGSM